MFGKYLLAAALVVSLAMLILQLLGSVVFSLGWMIVVGVALGFIIFASEQYYLYIYAIIWAALMYHTGDVEAPIGAWEWMKGFIQSFKDLKY